MFSTLADEILYAFDSYGRPKLVGRFVALYLLGKISLCLLNLYNLPAVVIEGSP